MSISKKYFTSEIITSEIKTSLKKKESLEKVMPLYTESKIIDSTYEKKFEYDMSGKMKDSCLEPVNEIK